MRRTLDWAVPLLLLAAGVLGLHGGEVLSGFDIVPGDTGDARIMAFLLESGRLALLGHGSMLSPPMFFPATGTRAYTDGHLLWMPLYGALRWMGLDVIRALGAMYLVLLTGGAAAAYALFRRALGVGSAPAGLGAFLFVFCNALTIKLGHGQMIGVVVLPVILLLLHASRGRAWLAVLAGVLTGLLAATSYIVAWFSLFFGGIALALALITSPEARAAVRRGPVMRAVLGYAGGLLAGLLPFLWIYGPEILHGRRRSGWDVYMYRPMGTDVFNLGDNHPVWGGFLAYFGIPDASGGPNVERFMGQSPPVWLLAILGFGLLFVGFDRLRPGRRALVYAALATAIGTALQFRYLPQIQPWQVILRLVPGAAAIRTTFRSELVAMLPISGLVAYALHRIGRGAAGGALAVLLGAATLLEVVHVHAPYDLRASTERALVMNAPAPPPGCTVFAIAPSVRGSRLWFVLQSDALMLALHWGIPTINGNSSWVPEGWDLREPDAPTYPDAMAHWVRAHGLAEHACLFDVVQNRFLDAAQTASVFSRP